MLLSKPHTILTVLLGCSLVLTLSTSGARHLHFRKNSSRHQESKDASISPSETEAMESLTSQGASVRRSKTGVSIRLSKFTGSKDDFKKITAIKSPIHLTCDLQKRHEWTEIIKDANIFSLFLYRSGPSRGNQLIEDEKIRLAILNLARCKTLRRLTINQKFAPRILNGLDQFSNLEDLSLPESATDETVSRLNRLKKLSKISISRCPNFTGSAFRDFSGNESVTELQFVRTPFKRENLRFLKNFKNLSSLALFMECDNEDIRIVSEVAPQLKEIWIPESNVNDRSFESFARMKNLERLNMSNVSITDRFLKQLDKLEKLNHFWCGKTFVTESAFNAIRVKDKRLRTRDGYFKPKNDKERDIIFRLIDLNVPIRAAHSYRPKHSFPNLVLLNIADSQSDFSKLTGTMNQLDIRFIQLKCKPSSGTYKYILQLKKQTQIFVYSPDVPDSMVRQLKARFRLVTDLRKTKR